MERALLSSRFAFGSAAPVSARTPKALAALKAFQEELAAGAYRFESAPCFCGETGGTRIAERDAFGLSHPYLICRRCGLLRAEPRMDQASYARFYKEHYRALYGDDDIDPDKLWDDVLAKARELRDFARMHIPIRPKLVLDVGCSMGYMLMPYAEEGIETFGVDYGEEYLKRGRARGLRELHDGGIDVFLATGRKADLIISSHAVEHFLDLGAELEKFERALSPEGRLLIIVPGLVKYTEEYNRGDFLGVLQNAHTFQFTHATLDYVFECGGFKREAADDEIRAIFTRSLRRRDQSEVPLGEHDRTLNFLRALERRQYPRYLAKRALEAFGLKAAVKRAFRR